jgi:hypothetical protein
MSDKPILFSAPMVRALLAGTKTQTRRIIKPQPKLAPHHEPVRVEQRGECRWVWMVNTDRPSYQFATGDWTSRIVVGDRLWVREKHWGVERLGQGPTTHLIYDEEWAGGFPDESAPLRPCGLDFGPHPSIHMFRWASRLTLTVTEVRVQRLQDINEADADAECFGGDHPWVALPDLFPEPHEQWGHRSIPECYGRLWDSINGPGSWDANPWVAAYTFTVERRNIDDELL